MGIADLASLHNTTLTTVSLSYNLLLTFFKSLQVKDLLSKEVEVSLAPTLDPVYNQAVDQSVRCTPYSIAVLNGHQTIVAMLIDAGMLYFIRDSSCVISDDPESLLHPLPCVLIIPALIQPRRTL